MSQISPTVITGRESGKNIIRDQDRFSPSETVNAAITISKIGFWSALLTALCSVGYGMAVIAVMVVSLSAVSSSQVGGWTGIEDFLAAFEPIQMLPVIPSLFLAPAFVALMVSIHSYAAEERKIWSRLGLAFSLIYAAMAATNYMIQLLPVWRSINAGETDGLAMVVLGNPHSIFWGLAYAYIFMNLGMLFSAPVFSGDRLGNRTRFLFLLNGISGVVTLACALLDCPPPIYLLGSLVFWWPVFTAAVVSTALLFNRNIRDELKAQSGQYPGRCGSSS